MPPFFKSSTAALPLVLALASAMPLAAAASVAAATATSAAAPSPSSSPAAHPVPLSAADEKAVQAVITAQLAAFAKDDAIKAFSYAAPNIRQAMDNNPEGFIAMVKKSYPVVYRPSAVIFLKPERLPAATASAAITSGIEQVIQRVQMQDANGQDWLAVYGLERVIPKAGKGGKLVTPAAWRINGCVINLNKGRTA